MKNVLLINVCREKLHYYEFVKPIEDILIKEGISFETKFYKDLNIASLKNKSSVIICGTALKDFEYEKSIHYFEWVNSFDKPVLGICAGMQIIGLIFGGKIKNKTEIGYFNEDFKKDFFGLRGTKEVYHLHNAFVDFKKLKEFDIFSEGNYVVQAIKHKNKYIYGVLFHPEVRQKELIRNFALN